MERAEDERNQMTDWRAGKAGLASKQREIGQLEIRSRSIRVFQPAVIPGLLQVSEYSRAIMSASQRMLALSTGETEPAGVYEAVSARLRRHQVLDDAGRHFSFVITESALSNRLGRPEGMLTQIERIRAVAEQPNVTVGIIPADAQLTDPPTHGFELIDEKWLIIDLFNTSMTSQGRSDIRLYRQLFDQYEQQAVTEIGATLDRYFEIYRDLSRPRQPSS